MIGRAELASAWGVESGYHAISGDWVPTSDETADRLLHAMGARDQGPPSSATLVHRAGDPLQLPGEHEIRTEDGNVLRAEACLPEDLPLGYHRIRRLADGEERHLILTPGHCHLPDDLRGWAWAVQLYAARSRASWGIGDLADLRELARWGRRQGATTLLVNPLHAPLPTVPQEPSPYFPSTRLYRNPLYLRVEEVPGAERLASELEPLARAGRGLNDEREIDRDRAWGLKDAALRTLYDAFGGDPGLDAYLRREGEALRDYATFCAITREHRAPWRAWPEELRHPRGAAVERFRRVHEHEVGYHQWLQWLLDRQLGEAARELPPLTDLAVGVDPDGADAWLWQDHLAPGISVGAPPDPFAPEGQDWSVQAFDPWKMSRDGYQPFARTVRAALDHAFGLRLDHVMGLFRLYWVPTGGGPGGYVRYPSSDLLGVLALESMRAKAVVVGEDLGTVEDHVREELSHRRVLSYRLLWFEDRSPADYPRDALAALTTHDLPTLSGIWTGADPDPAIEKRLLRYGGARLGESVEEAALTAYAALAASPCRLVAAPLEDALEVSERPNRPGTREATNWSLALPVPVEELEADGRTADLARTLRR
ncbi:MAG TPA: 4-alpha-glucanotransferase [Candidatus Dormibacteraeota bacterium]|nr:4-alpha-glucanotransferase [Candidatus Dormibacteraeota bacterium]